MFRPPLWECAINSPSTHEADAAETQVDGRDSSPPRMDPERSVTDGPLPSYPARSVVPRGPLQRNLFHQETIRKHFGA